MLCVDGPLTKKTGLDGVLVFCLVLVFLGQGFDLGRRIVWTAWDSHYTAERSRQVGVSGDLLDIRQNGYSDQAKPPLHYGLTAMALGWIPDPESALIFWPLVFGAAVLLLSWVLARQVMPGNRTAAWLAVVLLASHFVFLHSSSTALLDTGMTAFLLLTVVGYEGARRYPLYWWLVWLGIALGFVHKLPLGLLYLALAVGVERFCGREIPRRGPHFVWARLLGVGLALAWLLYQVLRHGLPFLRYFYSTQMVERIISEKPDRWQSFCLTVWHFFQSGPLLVVLPLAALVYWGWQRGRAAGRDLSATALWAFGCSVFVLVFLPGMDRYLLAAMPFLAVHAAGFWADLSPRFRLSRVLWVGLVVVLALGYAGVCRQAFLEAPPEKNRSIRMHSESSADLGRAVRRLRTADWPVVVLGAGQLPSYCVSALAFHTASPDPLHFWEVDGQGRHLTEIPGSLLEPGREVLLVDIGGSGGPGGPAGFESIELLQAIGPDRIFRAKLGRTVPYRMFHF
ncbi:MAG: glycosyltransferase family 39 protein [Candidatus Methylacidiphilales bacterium]|nr:glycosyltransferase family 39 protein [Candidatus Methylacidiphilales bacterium]